MCLLGFWVPGSSVKLVWLAGPSGRGGSRKEERAARERVSSARALLLQKSAPRSPVLVSRPFVASALAELPLEAAGVTGSVSVLSLKGRLQGKGQEGVERSSGRVKESEHLCTAT